MVLIVGTNLSDNDDDTTSTIFREGKKNDACIDDDLTLCLLPKKRILCVFFLGSVCVCRLIIIRNRIMNPQEEIHLLLYIF